MSCGFCWPYFLSDSRWIQINITLIDFCPEAARFFRWLFNLLWLTGCTKNWLFSPSFRVELNTHNEIPSECSGRIRKSYGGRSIFSWDYCTKNGKNLAKQLVCECVNVFAWFNSSPSNRQTEWHRCAWIRTMIAAGCNFNEWYFLPVTMCTECVRSFRVLIFFFFNTTLLHRLHKATLLPRSLRHHTHTHTLTEIKKNENMFLLCIGIWRLLNALLNVHADTQYGKQCENETKRCKRKGKSFVRAFNWRKRTKNRDRKTERTWMSH